MIEIRELIQTGKVVCPVTKQKLYYSHDGSGLITSDGSISYPIVENVPILTRNYAQFEKEAKSVIAKFDQKANYAKTKPWLGKLEELARRDYRTENSVKAFQSVFAEQSPGAVLLNIGGGPGRIPELLNLNMDVFTNVDIVADAHDLPFEHDTVDAIKFRVESGGEFEDLPRNPANNAALLGDPRNDENLMLAGLHAAFLLFHNRAVDRVRSENSSITNDEAFSQAHRLTTWQYQWIILHEFLPLITGQVVIDDILASGRRYYNPLRDEEFVPVEFQIVYRFGHSMVRPSYRANLNGDNGQPFFGMIFDPAGEGMTDPVDLRGGARARRRFIDWETFFDFGGTFTTHMRHNKRIDTKVSTPLFQLPLGTIPGGTGPVSLMQRNLLRHLTWQLPSGQSIAREIGAQALGDADLSELSPIAASFVSSTPLLYYILKEAEVKQDGLRLGPVGARVVAEVFIGLLQLDPESYLNVQPGWVPTLKTQAGTPQSFRMIDLLTFAGVDPTSRDA